MAGLKTVIDFMLKWRIALQNIINNKWKQFMATSAEKGSIYAKNLTGRDVLYFFP